MILAFLFWKDLKHWQLFCLMVDLILHQGVGDPNENLDDCLCLYPNVPPIPSFSFQGCCAMNLLHSISHKPLQSNDLIQFIRGWDILYDGAFSPNKNAPADDIFTCQSV